MHKNITSVLLALNLISACDRHFDVPLSPQLCSPETFRCQGNRLEQCDLEGKNWNLYENCAALGLYCRVNECVSREQTPILDAGITLPQDAGFDALPDARHEPMLDASSGSTLDASYDFARDAGDFSGSDAGVNTADAGASIPDAGTGVMDAGRDFFFDAGNSPILDAGTSTADAGRNLADAGNPVSGCYVNNFDDLEGLVTNPDDQGLWSRNPDGYLQQTASDDLLGWTTAYIRNSSFSDFEARVRVRNLEDSNQNIGVMHKRLGLLFRYNPETSEGYVLHLELFNRDTFSLTLTDFRTNEALYSERLSCGSIGCQIGVWWELILRAQGNAITASLLGGEFASAEDAAPRGPEIFSVQHDAYHRGSLGFAAYHFNASHFDDLVVCEQ